MAPAQDSAPNGPVERLRQLSLSSDEEWARDQTSDELLALWHDTGPDDGTAGDSRDYVTTVIREGDGFLLSPEDGWVNPEISLVSWRHRDEQTTPRSCLIPSNHDGTLELSVTVALDQDDLPEVELRVVDDDTGEPVPLTGQDDDFSVPGERTVAVITALPPGWYRWEVRAPSAPVTVQSTSVYVLASCYP